MPRKFSPKTKGTVYGPSTKSQATGQTPYKTKVTPQGTFTYYKPRAATPTYLNTTTGKATTNSAGAVPLTSNDMRRLTRTLSGTGPYDDPTSGVLPGAGGLLPGYPGSGGSGGGGGGGGGGGLTAAQQKAMLDAWKRMGNPDLYQFQQLDVPDYQKAEFAPRDTAIYDAAHNRIGQEVGLAKQGIGQAYNPLMELLQSQKNPMADASWATGGQMGAQFTNLLGAAGQGQGQGMAGTNTDARGADQAFGNLMAMRGANEQAAYQSRLRQAAQDQAGMLAGVDRDAIGYSSMVDQANMQDQRQWAKDKSAWDRDEGRYSYEQIMQELMANWQGGNQAQQGNAGITNDWRAQQYASLMNLIPLINDPNILTGLV